MATEAPPELPARLAGDIVATRPEPADVSRTPRRRWSESLLSWFGLEPDRYAPAALSLAANALLLLLLALITINVGGRSNIDRRSVIEVDTELDIRHDLFESIAWQVEDQPMLRKPGGGPLRAATEPIAGDPGLASDVGQAVAGLNPSFLDPGDLFAPGAENPSDDNASGLGVADGIGGGGGSGIGSADFFGASAVGSRFVYVIDRSGSMTNNDAMNRARSELLASLNQLSPLMQFQVIFYNSEPALLDLPGRGLARADHETQRSATEQIQRVFADGGTDHEKALRKAIELRPDVIFLLTDADMADSAMVARMTALNQRVGRRRKSATIHVIQFHHENVGGLDKAIRKLAKRNKGTFRRVDTSKPPGAP